MANREQRGNREKRKPKANKPKPTSGQSFAICRSGWHVAADAGHQKERKSTLVQGWRATRLTVQAWPHRRQRLVLLA